MLDYRKAASDGSIIVYEYAIEGSRDKIGHVSLNTETGNAHMTDHEASLEYARYASKLMEDLEAQLSSGNLKEAGTLMWY